MRPIVDNKRRGGRCFSGRHFHSSESESQVLVANRQDKKKKKTKTNRQEEEEETGGPWRANPRERVAVKISDEW